MATEIIVRIVPGGMMASNQIEADKLDQFRGREMMVKISQPRNIRFHRLYFALLGVSRDMADTDLNSEQWRAYLTCGSGYCNFVTDNEGGVVAVPKSIAFANMSEDEFERLYNDTVSFVCQKFVLDESQLTQIVNFL